MKLGMNDLLITNASGLQYGFVVDQGQPQPVVHSLVYPNVNNGSAYSSPAQAGGVYDVRDSDGDKVIAHVDWKLGAGQESLDPEQSNASMFYESKNIDISRAGTIRLTKDVTYTAKSNTSGPIFSALGYLWLGLSNGALQYSSDNGANWTNATISASPSITGTISSFATDGTHLYFSIATGANPGIWVSTPGTSPISFTKHGTDHTTEAVRSLAYSGGMLYAATSSGAGLVDSVSGVFTIETADFMNTSNTSVALVPAGNSVFWVVSQGGNSYVYELDFDAYAQTGTFQQFTELPSGFTATCACGYLSMLYIGGYWESEYANVGKGTVYVTATNRSVSAPLFELGKFPEHTEDPTNVNNDNRVYAMTAAGKDLYVLTNRACYRWDIDDGGYSHVFDFMGSGLGSTSVTWNPGSNFSWDGTDLTSANPVHGRFPTGFSSSTSKTGTETWDHTGGIAKLTDTSTSTKGYPPKYVNVTISGNPSSYGETLSNTTGTTLEIKTGAECQGSCLSIIIRDGVREGRLRFTQQNDSYSQRSMIALYKYDQDPSRPSIIDWFKSSNVIGNYGAHTIRITLKGVTMSASIDGGTEISTTMTKANTSSQLISLRMAASSCVLEHDFWQIYDQDSWDGAMSIGSSGSASYHRGPRVCAIDSISLNSSAAVPTGNEVEVLSYSGIAYSKGKLVAPYSVASNAKTATITSSTNNANTTITISGSTSLATLGMVTGQVVYISGHSNSAVNGLKTATVTGTYTFTIGTTTATTGTGGTVTWNTGVGLVKTAATYSSSGYLTTSDSTFHSGSVLKNFRYIDISHDPLPSDSSIGCSWIIDKSTYSTTGQYINATCTRFLVNTNGYSIKAIVTLNSDTAKAYTPVVTGVNVVWNFVKYPRHRYVLDCRRIANSGNWQGDPETAINFLMDVANQKATFEDRLIGEYVGVVESAEVFSANYSHEEGPSGLVALTIREDID